jgi:hypothetical protein
MLCTKTFNFLSNSFIFPEKWITNIFFDYKQIPDCFNLLRFRVLFNVHVIIFSKVIHNSYLKNILFLVMNWCMLFNNGVFHKSTIELMILCYAMALSHSETYTYTNPLYKKISQIASKDINIISYLYYM